MGFRLRKSVRLLPGVRLNVGSKGLSVSLGGRGATVNINNQGTRTTLGLPGTGVSYSSYRRHGTGAKPARVLPRGAGLGVPFGLLIGAAAGAVFGMATGVATTLAAVIILPLLMVIYETRQAQQATGLSMVPSRPPSGASGVGGGFTSASGLGFATPTAAGSADIGYSTTYSGLEQTSPALPPLSPAGLALITPLLNQRAAIATGAPDAKRDAKLREIDAEIQTRLGEIAASPWRYT